jgi:Protein of unknown function DUF262
MNTTATNRKVRVLLAAIRNGTLEPRPEFQRRLVWNNRHKREFIKTVLMGYPFPEVYIAAGEVDPDTGEGKELLVDGQQRLTTLQQYFSGSADLRLDGEPAYADLPNAEKIAFLEYEVVVRDLGKKELDEIREIFTRINSTKYSLNAMELHNARFDGPFKQFGDELAADAFFEDNRTFKTTEVRRMGDVRFALTLVTTVMSTYFNRDDELETFLETYNDEFPERDEVRAALDETFAFVSRMRLPSSSRFWNKADLLTGLVETHWALHRDELAIRPKATREALDEFYSRVEVAADGKRTTKAARDYYRAALQASNDRGSRITRGRIVRDILKKSASA